MKSIKTITVIAVLATVLSVAMYVTINTRMESVAAVSTAEAKAEATEYNRQLSERLIRFGQVAFERGQIVEAKHFFQEAITADPTNSRAWKKYNSALLSLVSAKVEQDPGFLPDFSSDSGETNSKEPEAPSGMPASTSDDDGC